LRPFGSNLKLSWHIAKIGAFLFGILLYAPVIYADIWENPLGADLDLSYRSKIILSPFDYEDLKLDKDAPSLYLTPLSLDEFSHKVFTRSGLNNQIEIRSQEINPSLNLSGLDNDAKSVRSLSYSFYVGGIKIDGFNVRLSQEQKGDPLILGEIPLLNENALISISSHWPDINRSGAIARDYLAKKHETSNIALGQREKIYYFLNGDIAACWKIEAKVDNLPYSIVANEAEVFKSYPLVLDMDGSAAIYEHNILDGAVKTFPLSALAPTGRLENPFFKTSIYDGYPAAPAQSATGIFNFSPRSSQFAETSVFTNASRMLDWFLSIGYSTAGFPQMNLVIHAEVGGSKNNAVYDIQSGSKISIGDGDGVSLRNLATDSDVISHELSHHVIYQNLKAIDDYRTLMAHEGLADFFTFIKSGNACLGESICPAASGACISNRCLRSAENQYLFHSEDLPSEPHKASQVLSGMLWDLKIKDNIEDAILAKITLKAVSYMPEKMDFGYFVAALLNADLYLTGGLNCELIYNRASERGLYDDIQSFGCGRVEKSYEQGVVDRYPSVVKQFPTTQDPAAPQPSRPSKSKSWFCGVIRTGQSGSASIWLMLSMPIFGVIIWGKKKPKATKRAQYNQKENVT
jgi:hypothetical protein